MIGPFFLAHLHIYNPTLKGKTIISTLSGIKYNKSQDGLSHFKGYAPLRRGIHAKWNYNY